MDTTHEERQNDLKTLARLARKWKGDEAPALLRNAQIEMTIRDFVRATSNEKIEELRKSTATEIWNRATAHLMKK